MSGASIHPNVKTVSVQYFQNRAPIVNPSLSQVLTNKLKEKIESQTSLILVNGTGDVDFQGSVTDYSTSPTSITGDQIAAENIFKISVKVKFNNMVDPSTNYEASFSKTQKYPSTEDFAQAEAQYTEEIVVLLVDDIFNKAFVNW